MVFMGTSQSANPFIQINSILILVKLNYIRVQPESIHSSPLVFDLDKGFGILNPRTQPICHVIFILILL